MSNKFSFATLARLASQFLMAYLAVDSRIYATGTCTYVIYRSNNAISEDTASNLEGHYFHLLQSFQRKCLRQ